MEQRQGVPEDKINFISDNQKDIAMKFVEGRNPQELEDILNSIKQPSDARIIASGLLDGAKNAFLEAEKESQDKTHPKVINGALINAITTLWIRHQNKQREAAS